MPGANRGRRYKELGHQPDSDSASAKEVWAAENRSVLCSKAAWQASCAEAESESQLVAQLFGAAAAVGTRHPDAAVDEDEVDEDDPMGFPTPCRKKRPRRDLGTSASAAASGAASSSAAAVAAPAAADALVLVAQPTVVQVSWPSPGGLAHLARLAVGAHTKALEGMEAYRASHPPECDPPPALCAGLAAKATVAALATSVSAAAAAAFLPAGASDPRKHG